MGVLSTFNCSFTCLLSNTLKTMFFKNGYSIKFFDRVFNVFDNRQVNEQLNVESTKRDIDFKCMFKVPYVGLVSHEFKKKVINLFFHDLGVEIFPIFKSCKLSGFFSLKSQTPKELILMPSINIHAC